jgi:hypothetical protein
MAVEQKLIGEFLVELSEDPSLVKEYQDNQKEFLEGRSDLSQEQKDVLLTNDLKTIREAIRDEYRTAEVIVVPLPAQHVA